MPPQQMHTSCPPPLLNRKLVFLLAATFLAYANISIFFQFYEYLRTLPIDPKWFGLLIGVFSATSLLVRPLVSPFFHAGNAQRYLYIGVSMVLVALASYSLAGNFWSMLLVRIMHGLAFVIVGTALMSLIVHYIPKDRSAQAFGLVAILTLVPQTVIPPVLPCLNQCLGGFTAVLMLFAGITALIFPLIPGAGASGGSGENSLEARRLSRQEIMTDMRDTKIIVILAAMLLLYCGHALIFFFLDGYGQSIGIGGTGFFLSLATVTEIGVRVGAGSFFDRLPKEPVAALTMVGLALGYGILGHVSGKTGFFALGVVLGLGWGVAMPIFNGLMFDTSAPRFRAFNINLGLQMFQGGFFLGPFIGGPIVAHWGFTPLFHLCAAISLISACFCFYLSAKRNE